MTVKKADFQDALNIGAWVITVKGEEWGFVTWVTIDWKSPEDTLSCIGGSLRRRKPETTDWTVDAAILYDNVINLEKLKSWAKFNIELSFVNPDKGNADNIWQKLIIRDCSLNDHSISISENSTFKMSGKARKWSIESWYTGA
jgi:hypothetical protein